MNTRDVRVKSLSGVTGAAIAVFASAILLMVTATQTQAQTLDVLHTFTGGADGGDPMAGLTQDSAGNLYGTTYFGGTGGNCGEGECGVVFRVTHHGSGWVETPIYTFKGVPDGAYPMARVIFGPDGALYGTTFAGGTDSSCGLGCGTVFKLQPPPAFCASISCPWRETVLHSFALENDGNDPQAEVVFDQAGNLYGTTQWGGTGACQCGTVFKLTHNADGSWSETILYSFQGGTNDGQEPLAGLVFDQAGNLYGTTEFGGGTGCELNRGCGTVFELTPSGSGWTETVLHIFTDGADGAYPNSGVIFDSQGNLYGAAAAGGQGIDTGNGTVFELTPVQGGGWNFSVQYTFNYYNNEANGPGPLTMDAAGNIYGSSDGGGAYGAGTAYKLTRSNGGWSYATLYSFGSGDGSQGFFPEGKVVLDTQGNLYSTASQGPYPSPDAGTVWELTQ